MRVTDGRAWFSVIQSREVYHAYDIAHNSTTPAGNTATADYWLSFIVSQPPNDGKRVFRAASATKLVSVMLPLIDNAATAKVQVSHPYACPENELF